MGCLMYFMIFAIIMALIGAIVNMLPIIAIVVILIFSVRSIKKMNLPEKIKKIRLKRFEDKYYSSNDFLTIKRRVEKYINNCNELNEHILELRNIHLGINKLDYGKSTYYDTSDYNYSRPEYNKHFQSENVCNCSRTVCDNARMQPFKYVCKYFNINQTEETLEKFENLLNNLEAAREGQVLLKKEKNRILESIEKETPPIIKKYGMDKFQRKLGFKIVEFGELQFQKYVFQYVSPGGNASLQCDVVMDIDNLNSFINYLSEIIKFRNSVQGQRALMTSSLRRKILKRDNFTCQCCGNSNRFEPNLLLEIDHIIPLAKGGMTTENNLQVLCWKCNRKKGTKVSGNSKVINEIREEIKQKTVGIPCESVYNSEECIQKRIEKESVLTTSEEINKECEFNSFSIEEPELETTKKDILKKSKQPKKEEGKMYDKENGIYPSGRYLIGRDLPLGGYLFKAKDGKNGSVTLYRSYKDCINEEDEIFWDNFSDDYFISLVEEGQYIYVENADIKRV